MISFNCTVRDVFRRPYMLDRVVKDLADNGYTEYVKTYAIIKANIRNALSYASENMKDYEYEVAVKYLNSRLSEQAIAEKLFYTHRTIRRYIRKACDLIRKYYADCVGIRLLPCDTRYIECTVPAGSFWEKVDFMMGRSIENAGVVILCCHENRSVNYVCRMYCMGSEKVKRIVDTFDSVVTVSNIPTEKASAV